MEGFGRAGEEVGVVREVGPGGGEDRGRESMVAEVEGVEESDGEVDGGGRGRRHRSLGRGVSCVGGNVRGAVAERLTGLLMGGSRLTTGNPGLSLTTGNPGLS
eukprot:767973-Hanusia_phi.AAC.10